MWEVGTDICGGSANGGTSKVKRGEEPDDGRITRIPYGVDWSKVC
jgi:hypothetical protein